MMGLGFCFEVFHVIGCGCEMVRGTVLSSQAMLLCKTCTVDVLCACVGLAGSHARPFTASVALQRLCVTSLRCGGVQIDSPTLLPHLCHFLNKMQRCFKA